MLQLKNIKKTYVTADNKVEALKGISLDFRSSEFVSVLGHSGCGKTTLLNIIGGLDKYTDGDLIIKGKSTKNFSDGDWDAYRNHSIGFVFQSYNLIPHLNVLGNVELALTLSGVSASERKEKAIEALKRVGLGEQIYKKPNQLSGGQMQRVAIARALVNNPEILLADEPTGALDTATSIQIMDLIKEISGERLVIMVTHNPDIAEKYSSRIIKVSDGEVISDSNPYTSETEINQPQKNEKHSKKNKHKTSMSFFTALSLSFKNLISKKARTIITSIAGSIGIIGVALVLSLSNGFGKYIDKMQSDTLATSPVTITKTAMNYSSIMEIVNKKSDLDKYPALKKLYVNNLLAQIATLAKPNNISEEYVNYIKGISSDKYNYIDFDYGFNILSAFYVKSSVGNNKVDKSLMQLMMEASTIINSYDVEGSQFLGITPPATKAPDNKEFIESQYDLIYGNKAYPTEKNELVLVVDENNRLLDISLYYLGFATPEEIQGVNGASLPKEFDFEEIIKTKYHVLTLDELFSGSNGIYNHNVMANVDDSLELNIVGIIRPNALTQNGALNSGIVYSSKLIDFLMEENRKSQIAQWIKENPTGTTTIDTTEYSNDNSGAQKISTITESYFGTDLPNSINIYAKDFDSKNEIKNYLEAYNEKDGIKDTDNEVHFSDLTEMMMGALKTLINAISIVLIAFTSISLVVSSVMIGIITYTSVVERTKEIGVLRSIGARKKDISRVFNAETFIIGLASGFIGVIVAVLLDIPISLIVAGLVEGIGTIAQLSIIHAFLLIAISIFLTYIAGLIPSKIAANKDPVVALRNE